jgi:hypothetical protein
MIQESCEFKESQLTGEGIRKLLFGSTITGFSIGTGQPWWVERKKNGETKIQGPEPNSLDTGKSRVEGDLLRTQFQKNFWRLEYCFTVFRNPRGIYERKGANLNVTDFGFSSWSMAR